MNGGVIVFEKTGDKKRFKISKYTTENTDAIFVVKFCCSYSSFFDLRLKKQKKLLKSCIKQLFSNSVEIIYLENAMYKNYEYRALFERFFTVPDGDELLFDMTEKIALMYAEVLKINFMETKVGLYCSPDMEKALEIIRKISAHTKYITLFCNDKRFLEVCAKKSFDALGICIDIKEDISLLQKCGLIILQESPGDILFHDMPVICLEADYSGRAVRDVSFSFAHNKEVFKECFDVLDSRVCSFIMALRGDRASLKNAEGAGFVAEKLLYTL